MSSSLPTPDVTVRQAAYFAAAASSGTMTAAGQQLGVSQSAVSLAIAQLEARLGVRLFTRHRGQPLSLTADGQRALPAAQHLVEAAARLQVVAVDQEELTGSITVGWFSPLSPVLLPRILDELRERHPQLELIAREGLEDDLWSGLDHRTDDVVITYGLMVPERFAIDVVHEVDPRVLLPAGHRLADQSEVSLGDLVDEPAIVFEVSPGPEYFATLLGEFGAQPRVARKSRNIETIRSLVARGEGYTIAVTPVIDGRSLDGLPIASRPIADDVPPTNVVLVRATPQLTRRTAAFLDTCRKVARDVFGTHKPEEHSH